MSGGVNNFSPSQKTCTSCLLELPITKFKKRGKTGRQSHTFHSMCNRCLYIKYTRPDAQKKTEEIRQYKMEQGCVDCGFNAHPAALEFDHRPGTTKLFNVGEKTGSYTRDKIWEEISKCDVVCANCHAIRTTERRQLIQLEVAS